MRFRKYPLKITLIFVLSVLKFVLSTVSAEKSITIEGRNMQAYLKGSGDKTIVLLSGFGTDNPAEDFATLSDKLSNEYKVVILEYFGYGLSDITEDERTNENIVNEIRIALDKLNIGPPYVLMPHSMSGLYSLYYASKYPNEVGGIIGIDMSIPQKQLERWSYENFQKVKMPLESNVTNASIVNQWNKFYDNSKELENTKYPENLPVLMFLATEQVELVDDMIKLGDMKTSWIDINRNMITNSNIQIIETLKGTHYLHHEQADKISEISKKFIESKM